MIEINIPGKPIAKKRPRFARRGNYVMTYSDQETEEGKTYLICKDQIKASEPLDGALILTAVFTLPRPKNHFGTGKKSDYLKPSAPVYPTGRPDTDNYLKFYMDILNGLAWRDDSQIVHISARKKYSDCVSSSGDTEIKIVKINENNLNGGTI